MSWRGKSQWLRGAEPKQICRPVHESKLIMWPSVPVGADISKSTNALADRAARETIRSRLSIEKIGGQGVSDNFPRLRGNVQNGALAIVAKLKGVCAEKMPRFIEPSLATLSVSSDGR